MAQERPTYGLGIYYDRSRARTLVLAHKLLRSTLAKRTWLTARSFRQQLTHKQKLGASSLWGVLNIWPTSFLLMLNPKQFASNMYMSIIHIFIVEHASIVLRLYEAMTETMMRNCLAIICHVAVPYWLKQRLRVSLTLS